MMKEKMRGRSELRKIEREKIGNQWKGNLRENKRGKTRPGREGKRTGERRAQWKRGQKKANVR